MKVAIIGNGYVGKAMARFFARRYEVLIHDPAQGLVADVNSAELAVVCVPTPSLPSGRCDTSIVEDVVEGLGHHQLILIKSTVPPGTTERLRAATFKRVVFSPEYMGESKYFTAPEYPHPTDLEKHRFFIFGGPRQDTSECVDIVAPIVGPHAFFYQVDSATAEIIKYWENAWGAMKVSFCNEMARICQAHGVDYWQAREGWALDSRVEKMHTAVFREEPGFSGKCFPKDIAALYMATKDAGYDSSILKAVIEVNHSHQSKEKLRAA